METYEENYKSFGNLAFRTFLISTFLVRTFLIRTFLEAPKRSPSTTCKRSWSLPTCPSPASATFCRRRRFWSPPSCRRHRWRLRRRSCRRRQGLGAIGLRPRVPALPTLPDYRWRHQREIDRCCRWTALSLTCAKNVESNYLQLWGLTTQTPC